MIPGSAPVRFRPIDAVVLLAAAAAIALLLMQTGSVLNYHWKWAQIPRFFLRWDDDSQSWVPNLLLLGFLSTLRLSIWGSAVAAFVGVAIGTMRLSSALGLRLISTTYVETVRNIPPLVLVFVIYFFLSTQIIAATGLEAALRGMGPVTAAVIGVLFGPPQQLASFLPGIIALGLFSGAYVAEIVRGGVTSIDRGQWEAAQALGLGPFAVFRKVILPQALSRMWGPLSNEFILLIKFSSLASLVSVPELTFQAYQVGVSTRSMFEVWLVVAAMYFCLSAGLAALFRRLEARARR